MRVRGWAPNSLIIKTSLYKLRIIKTSPHTHTPLRQLADFLQRGRYNGQYTRISYHNLEMFIINEFMFPYKFSKTEEYQK